jgi:hypothetical protein
MNVHLFSLNGEYLGQTYHEDHPGELRLPVLRPSTMGQVIDPAPVPLFAMTNSLQNGTPVYEEVPESA